MATAVLLCKGSVAGLLEDVRNQPGQASELLVGLALKPLPEHLGHRDRDPLGSALREIHSRTRG
jgi:hypothetical protein